MNVPEANERVWSDMYAPSDATLVGSGLKHSHEYIVLAGVQLRVLIGISIHVAPSGGATRGGFVKFRSP